MQAPRFRGGGSERFGSEGLTDGNGEARGDGLRDGENPEGGEARLVCVDFIDDASERLEAD